MKQTIFTDKFLRKKKIAKYAKIIKELWEKKAENVVALDITKFYTYADYVLICTGTSTKHTQSIADAIYEKAKEQKKPILVEGYDEGTWILLDLGELVVHIFTEDKRGLYNLEGLWFDAPYYQIKEKDTISNG